MGQVVALFLIPVVLNALHAEVVSTGNSRRIPENLAADSTAEVIHPQRDVKLCHVCEEKGGMLQVLFPSLLK